VRAAATRKTDRMAALDENTAVRRLYDRFGFGPGRGEVAAAGGFDAAVTALLSAVDDGVAPGPPRFDPEPARPKKDSAERKRIAAELRRRQTAITVWWLDRMVATTTPLTEKLTWFWHGHFATSAQKVRSPALMLAQNETLRRLGTGDFALLAKAMVVDPAMLIWLDGQKNTAKAANENLGRELMELFTIGVGTYTEDDVREAARALTGWRVNRTAGTATLAARQHDSGEKTVLGTTADLDATGLVDVLLARPESARFVAGRMWARLVSGTEPAADVLDRLVAGYGANRDPRGLLRAIAAEPAFRDEASTLVKQPVEWLVGLLRALELRPSTLGEREQTMLLAGLRGMGQVPFLPPSVGGWPAGPAWLTTSAGLTRVQLARLLTGKAQLDGLRGGDPVAAVAELYGVASWSERTAAALKGVAGQPAELAAVAAVAPEYVVST
jgi:uncharacterized protein (DUF1800 family)